MRQVCACVYSPRLAKTEACRTRGQRPQQTPNLARTSATSGSNTPRLLTPILSMASHISPSREGPSPVSVQSAQPHVQRAITEDVTNHDDDDWSEEDEEEGPKRKRARPLSAYSTTHYGSPRAPDPVPYTFSAHILKICECLTI